MTNEPNSVLKVRDRRWYGLVRDTRDPRDKIFSLEKHKPLPPSIDLRDNCPPVMNQGELGSCTAHGIIGALRYLLIKSGKPDVDLSRLQLYYDERRIEGDIGSDAGAEIRDGIKVAHQLGVALEKDWPYEIRKFREAPPSWAYNAALDFQALTYERVPVGTNCMKLALSTGCPVVFGISLFDSFESDEVARTGMVPMPNLKREEMVGGHCMYCVGYGQKKDHFTVRNSWDIDWGDKGDCYFPEAMLGSKEYTSDCWLIRTIG